MIESFCQCRHLSAVLMPSSRQQNLIFQSSPGVASYELWWGGGGGGLLGDYSPLGLHRSEKKTLLCQLPGSFVHMATPTDLVHNGSFSTKMDVPFLAWALMSSQFLRGPAMYSVSCLLWCYSKSYGNRAFSLMMRENSHKTYEEFPWFSPWGLTSKWGQVTVLRSRGSRNCR